MSLLDTASLIVTPNGYKEGKLYSVIPSDGSGDMSVVRATTATRVNSAGLVELVPYNLFTYSQTFSNADWTKNNVTLTGGQSGYDGSSNAFLLTDNSTNDVHVVRQTPIVSGQYTISVYAKANTLNFVWLRGVQNSANVRAWFNLSTGAVGTVETNGTATIESVGNGWYRCSLTIADFQSGFESYIGASNANGTISYVGSGQSIYIQNAQSNLGLIKPYQRTETRLNIPRLDYSNGSCPSLLVEPQRTNIVTYSEDFSDSSWTKTNCTITANSTISPSGIQNADTISSNSASDARVVKSISISPSTTYSFSIYVKKDNNENRFPEFVIRTEFTSYIEQYVQLNTKTGATVIRYATSGTSHKVESFGDYWRLILTITGISDSFCKLQIVPAATDVIGTFNPQIGSIVAWGFQGEQGSYPTSYIPTTSAAVTRNADAISKTGISSLIGQTEGTIFWEGQVNGFGLYPQLFDLNAGGNKYIQIYNDIISGNPTIGIYVQNVSLLLNNPNIATIAFNTNFKFALGYKANDYVVYLNGTQVFSNTTIGVPPTSNFGLGDVEQTASTSKKNVKATAIWKTRLTNAQLAQLTTI
jgi:hypothetical protein